MSISRRLLLVSVAVLAGTAVFAGCGEQMISQDDLTSSITSQYKTQTGLELKDLKCDDVKAEKGAAISCTAVNSNDVDLKIGGTVSGKNESSDKWGFDWKVEEARAPATLFEGPAAKSLSEKLGFEVSSVDCPGKILVKAGTKVHCDATAADGSTSGVTITLTDSDGNFEVAVDGK